MKKCSLHDFMEELRPWLDTDYIRSGEVNAAGQFTLHFLDGMKNVYLIDDCNQEQLRSVIADLKKRGIPVTD